MTTMEFDKEKIINQLMNMETKHAIYVEYYGESVELVRILRNSYGSYEVIPNRKLYRHFLKEEKMVAYTGILTYINKPKIENILDQVRSILNLYEKCYLSQKRLAETSETLFID